MLWVSRCLANCGEFASIESLRDFVQQAAPAADVALQNKAPTITPVQYIRCPHCDEMMNRSQFSHGSGVVVDVCLKHGCWFDQGELTALVRFAQSGELGRVVKRIRKEKAELLEASNRGKPITTSRTWGVIELLVPSLQREA